MESLPLKISFVTLLLWFIASVFFNRKNGSQYLYLFFALIQFSCSMTGVWRYFVDAESESSTRWSFVWLTINDINKIEFALGLDAVGVIAWAIIAIAAFVTLYFWVLSSLEQKKNLKQRFLATQDAITLPLVCISLQLMLMSESLLFFYVGWSLFGVAGFLSITHQDELDKNKSNYAYRFYISNLLTEITFIFAMIGFYSKVNNFSFKLINATELPFWIISTLLCSVMFRGFQFPFLRNSNFIGSKKSQATSFLLFGYIMMSGLFFYKLYPTIHYRPEIEYFAVVPILSLLTVSFAALAQSNIQDGLNYFSFITKVVIYICGTIFLSGLSADYQAAMIQSFSGVVTVLMMFFAFKHMKRNEASSLFFLMFAMLCFSGFSMSSWGWARYLEYVGLMRESPTESQFHWFVLSAKVFSDLVMGLALWIKFREIWLAQREQSNILKWNIFIPSFLISVGLFSFSFGGRLFGGILGEFELQLLPLFTWFEKNIVSNSGKKSLLEVSVGDLDSIAKIVLLIVFILPPILATFWIASDEKKINSFYTFLNQVLERLFFISKSKRSNEVESFVWEQVIPKIKNASVRVMIFIEEEILIKLFFRAWVLPAKLIRKFILIIENKFLDFFIIDGIGGLIQAVGKNLRMTQNGQVQFYYAIGIILTAFFLIRFILMGH